MYTEKHRRVRELVATLPFGMPVWSLTSRLIPLSGLFFIAALTGSLRTSLAAIAVPTIAFVAVAIAHTCSVFKESPWALGID